MPPPRTWKHPRVTKKKLVEALNILKGNPPGSNRSRMKYTLDDLKKEIQGVVRHGAGYVRPGTTQYAKANLRRKEAKRQAKK